MTIMYISAGTKNGMACTIHRALRRASVLNDTQAAGAV